MREPACATCKLHRSFDRNPKSLIGRLWRWHASWCPGFKAYLRGLPEAERRAVTEAYGLTRK